MLAFCGNRRSRGISLLIEGLLMTPNVISRQAIIANGWSFGMSLELAAIGRR